MSVKKKGLQGSESNVSNYTLQCATLCQTILFFFILNNCICKRKCDPEMISPFILTKFFFQTFQHVTGLTTIHCSFSSDQKKKQIKCNKCRTKIIGYQALFELLVSMLNGANDQHVSFIRILGAGHYITSGFSHQTSGPLI